MRVGPFGSERPVVVSDGVVIGQDPDAYVRFELLRDAAAPNQG